MEIPDFKDDVKYKPADQQIRKYATKWKGEDINAIAGSNINEILCVFIAHTAETVTEIAKGANLTEDNKPTVIKMVKEMNRMARNMELDLNNTINKLKGFTLATMDEVEILNTPPELPDRASDENGATAAASESVLKPIKYFKGSEEDKDKELEIYLKTCYNIAQTGKFTKTCLKNVIYRRLDPAIQEIVNLWLHKEEKNVEDIQLEHLILYLEKRYLQNADPIQAQNKLTNLGKMRKSESPLEWLSKISKLARISVRMEKDKKMRETLMEMRSSEAFKRILSEKDQEMIQDQNKSRDDKGLLPFDAMQMCDFIIQDRQIKRLSGPMGNIRDNDVGSTTVRRIKYQSDKRYNEEGNAHVREEYQENEDGHRGYRKQYRNKHRTQPGKYYSQQDYDPNMRLYKSKWDNQWEQENNQYHYPARNRGRGRGRHDRNQYYQNRYHNNGRYENQAQNQQRWATPEMGHPRKARRPPRHYEPPMQKATRYVERITTQPWKESNPRMGRTQDKVYDEEEEDETDSVFNSDEEEEEDEDEDAHEDEDDAWEDEEEEDEEYEVEAERPQHKRY